MEDFEMDYASVLNNPNFTMALWVFGLIFVGGLVLLVLSPIVDGVFNGILSFLSSTFGMICVICITLLGLMWALSYSANSIMSSIVGH